MMENLPLSTGQMTTMLDNAPVAIYVTAMDNRELLYTNGMADKLIQWKDNTQGITCYQAAGLDAPCPFCQIENMSESKFLVREFRRPSDGHIYQLTGKIVNWDGRPAHIEYILDITKRKEEEIRTKALKDELQTTFSSIPCGLSIYQFNAGTIVPLFHNPAFYQIMGYSKEHIKMVEQNTSFLGVHPEDVDSLQKEIQKAIAYDSVMRYTYRLYNDRINEYIWIHLEGSVKPQADGTKLLYGVYTDVSEQKRLELYFQSTIENLPGGVAVVCYEKDGNLKLELLSAGFAAMTDMTLDEAWQLYGQDAMGGVHPEDRQYVTEQLAAYATGGGDHFEMEYRLKKGKDHYIWVKNTLSLIENGENERRIYSVYHDMTKEREEKEHLRRQYEKLLLQHYRAPGPDTLVVGHCNVTHNEILEIIDYTGSALLETFGTAREEFFTGLSGLVVDQKEQDLFLNTYLNAPALAAFERGDTEQIVNCFINLPREKNGRYVQFKVNLVEAPDTGDITGILTVTDVTEQTISERILHRLSSTSYDLVAGVDLANDRYAILTYDKTKRNIPQSPGSYSEQTAALVTVLVDAKDKDYVAKMTAPDYMQKRLEKDGSYSFSYSLLGKSGKIFTKTMTISAVDLRIGRVCLAQTDVTAVLEADRQAKKSLEDALALAEKASRAKSDFLSTMSHDIRTPMNAIIGMTTLATSHLKDQAYVEDCLKKISVSSKHLLSLINDILDMNKIENSKITLNRLKIFLPEMIKQIGAIMEPQAQAAGVQFQICCEKVKYQYFYGDSLRINQILLNLLSNAIKFTPEGGKVDFLIEEHTAKTPGKARYCFTVSDTGIGMNEEFLSHIFDPFARNTKTEGIEGTGLGLSITKGLIELMDGEIKIESQVDKGSVFCVALECEIAPAEDRIPLQADEADSLLQQEDVFSGRCFLVAEDNAINAEIICELLAMHGAKSTVKINGAQTVHTFEAAPQGTYDAILMDIQMPEMNGYEATRAIRALGRPDAKTIPVIAMTANAFTEDIQAALDAGMNAHIAKPVDIEILKSTLNRVLGA